MDKLTTEQAKEMMCAVACKIIEQEPYLTEIDTIIGDGDHGTGMKRGFTALRKMLQTQQFETMDALMKACGMKLVKTMGGASGVLFGTFLIGGLEEIQGATELDIQNAAPYFVRGANAVMKRGRAQLGQKTMLDSMIPAVHALALAKEQGKALAEGLEYAYQAACEGVEETKQMRSGVGRSRNFGEQTVGLPDPGAISVSLIFGAMSEYVR